MEVLPETRNLIIKIVWKPRISSWKPYLALFKYLVMVCFFLRFQERGKVLKVDSHPNEISPNETLWIKYQLGYHLHWYLQIENWPELLSRFSLHFYTSPTLVCRLTLCFPLLLTNFISRWWLIVIKTILKVLTFLTGSCQM